MVAVIFINLVNDNHRQIFHYKCNYYDFLRRCCISFIDLVINTDQWLSFLQFRSIAADV